MARKNYSRKHREITVEPALTYASTACQQVTSSAFSIAIVVPGDALQVRGQLRAVQRVAGRKIRTRWLCAECGSWTTSGSDRRRFVRRLSHPGAPTRNFRTSLPKTQRQGTPHKSV